MEQQGHEFCFLCEVSLLSVALFENERFHETCAGFSSTQGERRFCFQFL